MPAHHNDNGDADTFSVLPGESGQTPEELVILAALNAEDEDAPQQSHGPTVLVGPCKPAAGFEVVPVPSLVVTQASLHLRTGLMRDRRKLVQLFDCPGPKGWQEGTVMRR